MATGLIGNISAFEGNVETWNTYEECLEQYFLVKGLENERKVAALLTLIGEKTYCLLRNLTVPLKQSEKSYDELYQVIEDTSLSETIADSRTFSISQKESSYRRKC